MVFLADGGFDGTLLQIIIDSYGWQYVCRTASSMLIRSGGARLRFGDLGVVPADAVAVLATAVMAARYVPVLAIAVWDADPLGTLQAGRASNCS